MADYLNLNFIKLKILIDFKREKNDKELKR